MPAGFSLTAALVRASLERIAAREAAVGAWAHLDGDAALEAARALDARPAPWGRLHGVLVGVKDVIEVRGMPTRHGSPLHAAAPAAMEDAAVVAVLRAEGAIFPGKTTTVEFGATGRPSATRNPLDPGRTPGGSSSGSAAAVADGHVPIALGTQTGGSILRPASFCGVFGFKPSWGFVSVEGVKAFAPTLDTVGWMARSVADLRLVYDVFAPMPAPVPAAHVRGARIAMCRTPFWCAAKAATRGAMAEAERRLAAAGAVLSTLELPAPFAGLAAAQLLIMRAEARASFLAAHRAGAAMLHPTIRGYVEDAARLTTADILAARDLAAECRARFDRIAGEFDAVLAPSAVGEAPVGLADVGDLIFNGFWTLLGVPCVNVPGLRGPAGMPVGLTVTGPRLSDARVLAQAEGIAAVLGADGR